MDEKRKFERFNVNVPARIEISAEEGQREIIDLETDSLSAGGVSLRFARSVPVGCPVKVEVVLKFEQLKTPADPEGIVVIAATGRVLRSGPSGMAIRFNEDYDLATRLRLLHKGN